MNCKQGDLAIVVSGYTARLGPVVLCEALARTGPESPALWIVDRVLPHDYGGGSNLEFDKHLRPLRNIDGEDEVMRLAGRPVGTPQAA